MKQSHVLIVDPIIKSYLKYNAQTSIVSMELRHCIRSLTLEELPLAQLDGLIFSKLVIIAGAVVQPEALNWVLSKLRDVKDDPSGIGN